MRSSLNTPLDYELLALILFEKVVFFGPKWGQVRGQVCPLLIILHTEIRRLWFHFLSARLAVEKMLQVLDEQGADPMAIARNDKYAAPN
ncbi:hypothetical protein NT239_04895 [Chitinibacter sp. SCUT-21]|uniref:hypothetical protein n=1 Tax=Chitinibacter sp. SCUT-21 TaxID=2970891 RepID=UPI0035A6E0AA